MIKHAMEREEGTIRWLRPVFSLSNNAPCTATTSLVLVSVLRIGTCGTTAVACNASLLCLVISADFPDKVSESLINIDSLFGGSFDELASKVLGEVTALVHANLAFVLQIRLIGDDDNREGVLILHTEDLLVEDADFLKRVSGSNGVDEKEALASPHVLLPHSAIFLLTGRVEDIEEGDLVVDDTLLTVRIFDSWVVLVNEV